MNEEVAQETSEENKKAETIQKYLMVYNDNEEGKEKRELFDRKDELKLRLSKLDKDNVVLIMKGRLLEVRVEERLVV